MAVRFADTTVLLYAISQDPHEQAKAARANDILAAGDVALSVQVLQEFYVQATRASRHDRITHRQALMLVESWLRFPVADVTTAVMLAACATRDRFQLPYWDAAILEAARSLGCDVVLSEDFSDGQDYGGVRVENPFPGTYLAPEAKPYSPSLRSSVRSSGSASSISFVKDEV